MKLKKQCIECKTDILFNKKDIKPVPEWKQKEMEERNKIIYFMLNRKKKNFWGKQVDYYSPWAGIELIGELRTAYGVIKCPVCNTQQLITNR